MITTAGTAMPSLFTVQQTTVSVPKSMRFWCNFWRKAWRGTDVRLRPVNEKYMRKSINSEQIQGVLIYLLVMRWTSETIMLRQEDRLLPLRLIIALQPQFSGRIRGKVHFSEISEDFGAFHFGRVFKNQPSMKQPCWHQIQNRINH